MAKYSNAISQMDFQYFSKKIALQIFKYIFLSYNSGASEIWEHDLFMDTPIVLELI